MAFFVTIPMSMINPKKEKMESVVPVSTKAKITPVTAKGSENMMTKGCRYDLNSEAMTM